MFIVKKINFFLIGLISLSLFSCIDEEGEGGTSVVQGKVFKVLHPDDEYGFIIDGVISETDSFRTEKFHLEADTIPAAKEDVFIVYGDEPVYGDKMEAGADGFYRFKYLVKGNYLVYAYTSYNNSLKEPVVEKVKVGSGDTQNVPNIYIHEGKSLGKSYIKGRVLARYYDKDGVFPAYGNEVRVYIRKAGTQYQFDEVRTGINGVFVFQNLDPGKYEVFAFTELEGYKIPTLNSEDGNCCLQTVTVPAKGVIQNMLFPLKITLNS